MSHYVIVGTYWDEWEIMGVWSDKAQADKVCAELNEVSDMMTFRVREFPDGKMPQDISGYIKW